MGSVWGARRGRRRLKMIMPLRKQQCNYFNFIWYDNANISYNAILVIYFFQSIFFTFRTFSVFRPELGPLFWKVIRIRNFSEPAISKKFRHRSVPVLCIFKYFRLRSVFRYLFWIFTRTRTFSVPVLWGRDTEKVRIRLRRSGYGLYLKRHMGNCAQ